MLISCISIAVLLWLGNKLSHEYEGFFTVNIRYYNLPDNYILGGNATDKLTLYVRAKGFYLLSEKLKGNKRVVDVNASLLPAGKEYVSAGTMKNILSATLNKNYVVISVQPDTFYYDFDKKYSRKIPVKLNVDIDFEPQYGLVKQPDIEPAEILISGTEKQLAELEYVETELLVFKKLKEDKKGRVKISNAGLANAAFQPDMINYTISVEKYTEHTIEAPVKVVNTPEESDIVIYPKKVKITCLVSLSNFEKVTADLFEATADFSDINPATDKLVNIEIKRQPEFVKNVNYSPKKAEFIIVQ